MPRSVNHQVSTTAKQDPGRFAERSHYEVRPQVRLRVRHLTSSMMANLIVPDVPWRLVCSAEQFDTLFRHDREFAFLATLARISCAIKFARAARFGAGKRKSNARARQAFGGFVQLAALMHEVLEMQRNHAAKWSGLTAWQRVFAVLDKSHLDADAAQILGAIRNRAAFHFDPTVAQQTIPRLPIEEFALLSGDGRNRMQTNSELADIMTMGFLFKHMGAPNKLYERYVRFHEVLETVAVAFCKECDYVILQRARARGLRIEKGINL